MLFISDVNWPSHPMLQGVKSFSVQSTTIFFIAEAVALSDFFYFFPLGCFAEVDELVLGTALGSSVSLNPNSESGDGLVGFVT